MSWHSPTRVECLKKWPRHEGNPSENTFVLRLLRAQTGTPGDKPYYADTLTHVVAKTGTFSRVGSSDRRPGAGGGHHGRPASGHTDRAAVQAEVSAPFRILFDAYPRLSLPRRAVALWLLYTRSRAYHIISNSVYLSHNPQCMLPSMLTPPPEPRAQDGARREA